MIFKAGIFLLFFSLLLPFFNGAYMVLVFERQKENLRLYKINKAEGKEITNEMKSAHHDFQVLKFSPYLAIFSLTLIFIGSIWEI
jgi:hypothetical protein